MEKALPEQYIHGRDLPPFLNLAVARDEILSCVVRDTASSCTRPLAHQ